MSDIQGDQIAELVRVPGELPCPSTGEAHTVISEPCEWVWHNRCEACGERWDTPRRDPKDGA